MMSWDSMETECGWVQVGRLGCPDPDFLGDFHDAEDGMGYVEAVNGMTMEESKSEHSQMIEGTVDNNADKQIPTSNTGTRRARRQILVLTRTGGTRGTVTVTGIHRAGSESADALWNTLCAKRESRKNPTSALRRGAPKRDGLV